MPSRLVSRPPRHIPGISRIYAFIRKYLRPAGMVAEQGWRGTTAVSYLSIPPLPPALHLPCPKLTTRYTYGKAGYSSFPAFLVFLSLFSPLHIPCPFPPPLVYPPAFFSVPPAGRQVAGLVGLLSFLPLTLISAYLPPGFMRTGLQGWRGGRLPPPYIA